MKSNLNLKEFAASLCDSIAAAMACSPETCRTDFRGPETHFVDPDRELATREIPPLQAGARPGGAQFGRRTSFGPSANPGNFDLSHFGQDALALFALQFEANAPYRKYCEARGARPDTIERWSQVPAMPTALFKELDLSCIPVAERTAVFLSSGTTGQSRSQHFHHAVSLATYEASLMPWFARHMLPEFEVEDPLCAATVELEPEDGDGRRGQSDHFTLPAFLVLTPPPEQAPRSSLVHMFEAVSRRFGRGRTVYAGYRTLQEDWALDPAKALACLRKAIDANQPVILMGTAFTFVHLLDYLTEENLQLKLPSGSRALETGGYKGRTRVLPNSELHGWISRRLGLGLDRIVCEYGMSELSSQAYSRSSRTTGARRPRGLSAGGGYFRFPPWAKVQVISPETGLEAAEGEVGLIRIFDLANVFSIMAIQTEDLGIKRGPEFELLGRCESAERRGCSLMTVDVSV